MTFISEEFRVAIMWEDDCSSDWPLFGRVAVTPEHYMTLDQNPNSLSNNQALNIITKENTSQISWY